MSLKFPAIACICLLIAACSERESSAPTTPATVDSKPAPAGARSAPAGSGRLSDRMQLPVPEPAGPPGPLSAKTLALTSAMIESAIVRALGEAASGIDVTVDQGIVRLSGDVRSEVDFQRANYVARAIDGVIEVDQRDMRVSR